MLLSVPYSLSDLKLKASVFATEPCCLIKARQQCRKKSYFWKSKEFKDLAFLEKNHPPPFIAEFHFQIILCLKNVKVSHNARSHAQSTVCVINEFVTKSVLGFDRFLDRLRSISCSRHLGLNWLLKVMSCRCTSSDLQYFLRVSINTTQLHTDTNGIENVVACLLHFDGGQ